MARKFSTHPIPRMSYFFGGPRRNKNCLGLSGKKNCNYCTEIGNCTIYPDCDVHWSCGLTTKNVKSEYIDSFKTPNNKSPKRNGHLPKHENDEKILGPRPPARHDLRCHHYPRHWLPLERVPSRTSAWSWNSNELGGYITLLISTDSGLMTVGSKKLKWGYCLSF